MKNLSCPVVAAGVAMLGLFASHPALSQTLSNQFVVPQHLRSTSGALIGMEDLNGDGRMDLLYQNSAQISTGNGTFKPVAEAFTFPIGAQLQDVNNDGKFDVVVAVPAAESCDYYPDGTPYCNIDADAMLQIYWGNGDGTFSLGPSFDIGPEGAGTASLSMVDVNGDGSFDAIVAFTGNPEDGLSQTGYVLLNDGKGTFKVAPGTYGDWPVLAYGDFNRDGHIDLVVGPGLQILNGKGDGSFTPGVSYSGVRASSATLGDFNNDGLVDLAVADNSGTSTTGIYMLWAQPGGTFASPKRFSTIGVSQIQVTFLTHDGYLDIAAGPSPFYVFSNQKNGTFSNPRTYPTPFDGGIFAIWDFNRDGLWDLAVSDTVSYGTASGVFQTPQVTMSNYPGTVAVADFNGDHIDDVAVINQSNGAVTVFPGTGQGYLGAGKTYNSGVTGGILSIGDVNGDGAPDLVVTRDQVFQKNGLSVLLNNGNGTFGAAITSSVLGNSALNNNFVHQAFAVDVNHDGKADLIGDWGVALGHGDGTFATPTAWPSQVMPYTDIAVGDVNNDSNVDVVLGKTVINSNVAISTIYTLLGSSAGTFTIAHQENLNYTNPRLSALTLADVNGDGALDLVYNYSATPSVGSYNRIVVEFNDGNGTFGNTSTGVRLPYNGGGYDWLLVGDFNRDGQPDVLDLTQSFNFGTYFGLSEILFGTGAGTLSTPQYIPVQMSSGALIDLNGDGALDIVGPAGSYGIQRVLNTGAK